VYLMPRDMQKNAFDLLNQICPLKGKKAVFVTVDGFFRKEDVTQNLMKVGVELKDYCESKYIEDYKAAIDKYNKDDEVGWILLGVCPSFNKKGENVGQTEMVKWDVKNRKKPTVTFWDVAVMWGLLCGLGVDLAECGTQMSEMAVQVLKGEKISAVKAQDPRKTLIVLNKKTADASGITFPIDILGNAWRVYTTDIFDPAPKWKGQDKEAGK